MSYQNRYAAEEQLEMQPYYAQNATPSTPSMPTNDFLQQVQNTRTEIRSLASNVQQIANLHQRALASANSNGALQQQLDQLIAAAQQKNSTIRADIQSLKVDTESSDQTTFALKRGQVESLTADFKKEVQRYLSEEQNYKSLCRDQIARQYRIVNPDATEEEARGAADQDWRNEGVFQTAVC
jgi:syntaxin 1B/2/3